MISGIISSYLRPFVKVCADSVRLGGGGVLSRVGDHILQEFYTLYATRFRTYNIAYPPQEKGRGLKQITSCRKVLLQVTF
jgi:hypothetical protein